MVRIGIRLLLATVLAAVLSAVLSAVLIGGLSAPAGGQLPGLPGQPAATGAAEGPGDGAAGPPGTAPDAAAQPADPADIAEFIRLLGDPGLRAWLEEQAAAGEAETAAAPAAGGSFSAYLHDSLERLRGNVQALTAGLAALPAELDRAQAIWALEMPEARTLRSLLLVGLFLAIGIIAEALYWWLTRDLRQRITAAPAAAPAARLSRTALRLGINGLAVGVFAMASLGAFLAFDWPPIVRLFIISLLGAFVIVRLINALSVFLFAPLIPTLRLVPLESADARYLHTRLLALAVLVAFGALAGGALEALGFLPQSRPVLGALLGLAVALLLIAMVWERRQDIAHLLLRGSGKETGEQRIQAGLVALLPWFATLYVLTIWALWVIGARGVMWLLLLLVLLPAADRAGRWAIAALFAHPHRPAQEGEKEEADRPEQSPFVPVLQRTYRVVLVILAMLILAAAFRLEWWTWTDSASPAAAVLRAVFNIVVTLLLADLAWSLARTAIDRKLQALAPAGAAEAGAHADAGGEGGGTAGPHARLQTLLPLVRKFILGVLVVMVALIVLSALGVDIGPLLAGAGVVGLAIGFGAQALVRDIVAGIFFLIDDAFRVGEYIEIGELRGTVEGISIRSLRLRHHRGAVHTIPFGEMTSVTNYSRDWVIMKLEFRIPFETDLAKVKKLVKDLGKELLKDPTIGHSFLEPLKSQGVRRWEEFNMVLGVKFMARPGEQWLIRREVYQRLRDRFRENGIEFASRDVQVRVSQKATPEDIEEAVQGAAIEAVGPPQPDKPSPAAG
ncbi:MAG: mechanosensitive ion channel [Alphaproteobacteria bacterium]|jgi:small-conductance mechanosensitive channel|nr:mechanosensitive ion channel [Alphaproteobacteria bacterium]